MKFQFLYRTHRRILKMKWILKWQKTDYIWVSGLVYLYTCVTRYADVIFMPQFFFLFRFFTGDYSESGNYRDSVENQSPSTNESFDLLYTEDMEELPDVDSLARYIYSTMSDSEMAFVTEFGRMLEQNFGEI